MASIFDVFKTGVDQLTSTKSDLQQQMNDAKDAMATAYVINTSLQAIGTIALVVIAYHISKRR